MFTKRESVRILTILKCENSGLLRHWNVYFGILLLIFLFITILSAFRESQSFLKVRMSVHEHWSSLASRNLEETEDPVVRVILRTMMTDMEHSRELERKIINERFYSQLPAVAAVLIFSLVLIITLRGDEKIILKLYEENQMLKKGSA